jgi:glycosyltransferase involved in cell wall biosynthesis
MKISILVPVYNEEKTIGDVLQLLVDLPCEKEIIVVDDRSTDGTREILGRKYPDGKSGVTVYYHEVNKGKGGAIRTALSRATGEYVIVQDADMEYSPAEITKLVSVAVTTGASAVFGSRFLSTWKATSLPHYAVNWFLTFLTNVLFGASLTDMETCYKMVRTDILKEMDIRSNGFEFEPEVTAKLLLRGVKIHEVPISYRGRGYDEGKKITWRDGVSTVLALFKYRFTVGIKR